MASLKWVLGIIAAILMLIGGTALYVQQHDGPVEIFAGGPFRSGELIEGVEPDWAFIRSKDTVELQLLEPPASRLLWVVEYDNRLYILSSFMNSRYGKAWKHWPYQAEKDPRALMRVDGKIYPRRLARLAAEEVPQGVLDRFSEKYALEIDAAQIESGSTWMYRLTNR